MTTLAIEKAADRPRSKPTTPPRAAEDAFLDELDARMAELIERIEGSEVWQAVMSPDSDPALVREVMKEIYLEIWSYQPHTVEAAFAIIGRLPKTEEKAMRTLVLHYIEEVTHAFQALRDYVALGGDEEFARSRRISPASFAVAAVWRTMAAMESPFAYLGMLLPFEALTPIVTGRVLEVFRARGFPSRALEFIEFHAEADVAHTKLVKHVIKQLVRKFPEAREAIRYGMDCFLQVYPLPVWNEALRRARATCQT